MKKNYKIFGAFLITGLIVFSVFYACNEKVEIKTFNTQKIYYSGFEDDVTYTYRSKIKGTNQSYVIEVTYNSTSEEVELDVNTNVALPDDYPISLTFIDVEKTITPTYIKFPVPENEGLWGLDLENSHLINVAGGPSGVGSGGGSGGGWCTLSCECPCLADDDRCSPQCDIEYPNKQWCETSNTPPQCLNADETDCCDEKWDCIAEIIHGPMVFIQADKVRYNNILYEYYIFLKVEVV